VSRSLAFIGATLGGAAGWWVGAWVGIATACLLSLVGAAAGVYAVGRIARRYLS